MDSINEINDSASFSSDVNTNQNMTLAEKEQSACNKKNDYNLESYQQTIEKDYAHNAIIQVSYSALWGLGSPFIMWATVGITYLTILSSPKTVIGLVQAAAAAAGLLQLIATQLFSDRNRKIWLACLYAVSVIPWIGYSVLSLLFPGLFTREVHIFLFAFSMIFFAVIIAVNTPIYTSLVADCTPVTRRGSLFGYATIALAFTLTTMSPIVHWIMKNWPEPKSYYISFLVGTILSALSSLMILLFREHRRPLSGTKNDQDAKLSFWKNLYNEVRKVIQNSCYRVFMFFMISIFVSLTVGAFIMVFAKEKLNLTGSQVLIFTILSSVGGAITSYILGRIADKIGYRVIGILQGGLLATSFLTMALMTIIFNPNIWILYTAFFLHAGVTCSAAMVLANMSIELLPKHFSGNSIAMGYLLILPANIIAPTINGLILDFTGSFFALFLIAAVLAIISSIGFILFVQEPRKNKSDIANCS